MNAVSMLLAIVAGILLVGAVGEIVFERTRVPDIVWLILVGWLLGPVAGILDRELLVSVTPYFAAFALIVILFNGGTSLKLNELVRAAPRALVLAVLGFATAAAAVAAISMAARAIGIVPEAWTWTHAALLGCILGGSSSIVVMPAMARARAPGRVADLLNLESALTDALCVVGASAAIALLLHTGSDASQPWVAVMRSFGLAFAVGALSGLLWLMLLHLLRGSEHAYPITLAALLLLYVFIEWLGASAALGVLTFAVVVGNASLIGRRVGMAAELELGTGVRGVHGQLAFMVKSFFFVLIGALLSPPWAQLLLGFLLALVLLVVRIPAVLLSSLGARFQPAERRLLVYSMPRGLAAGVLATIPAASGVIATDWLSTTAFACIIGTIAIFAVGLPMSMKQLVEPAESSDAPEAAAAVVAASNVPIAQPVPSAAESTPTGD